MNSKLFPKEEVDQDILTTIKKNKESLNRAENHLNTLMGTYPVTNWATEVEEEADNTPSPDINLTTKKTPSYGSLFYSPVSDNKPTTRTPVRDIDISQTSNTDTSSMNEDILKDSAKNKGTNTKQHNRSRKSTSRGLEETPTPKDENKIETVNPDINEEPVPENKVIGFVLKKTRNEIDESLFNYKDQIDYWILHYQRSRLREFYLQENEIISIAILDACLNELYNIRASESAKKLDDKWYFILTGAKMQAAHYQSNENFKIMQNLTTLVNNLRQKEDTTLQLSQDVISNSLKCQKDLQTSFNRSMDLSTSLLTGLTKASTLVTNLTTPLEELHVERNNEHLKEHNNTSSSSKSSHTNTDIIVRKYGFWLGDIKVSVTVKNHAYIFTSKSKMPSEWVNIKPVLLQISEDEIKLISKRDILAYYENLKKTFNARLLVQTLKLNEWSDLHG